MAFNAFGCPRTTLASHFGKPTKEFAKGGFSTSAIFITASAFNHSCYGNARRSFIGDMMILRATCDIQAETEIRIPYIKPERTDDYNQTQQKFSNWGFTCTCVLCEDKRRTRQTVFRNRAALNQDIMRVWDDPTGVDVDKVSRIVKAIDATYTAPSSKVPRLAVIQPYFMLVCAYSRSRKHAHVITTAWKLLYSLGFTRSGGASMASKFELTQWGLAEDIVIETWVHLYCAYAKLAPQLCLTVEKYARTSYKIVIGEDVTFNEKYGLLAQKVINEGKDLVEELEKMKI